MQPRVFERFLQAGSIQGTGLGLAISKGIIEMMGGAIGFESDEGRGSVFHFSVPRSETRSVTRGTLAQEA
jgi:signal transduction histidine kinase